MTYLHIDHQCRMWVELPGGQVIRVVQVWEDNTELQAQATDGTILRIDQRRPDPPQLVPVINWRRFFTADPAVGDGTGGVVQQQVRVDPSTAERMQQAAERLREVEEEQANDQLRQQFMFAASGTVTIDANTLDRFRAAVDLPLLHDKLAEPEPEPPAVSLTRAEATMLVDDDPTPRP